MYRARRDHPPLPWGHGSYARMADAKRRVKGLRQVPRAKRPPSSGASRHLLPEREKNRPAQRSPLIPLPLGERWLGEAESVRGGQIYPSYPHGKKLCQSLPVPTDNTRYRRSAGWEVGPLEVAQADAWMPTTGQAAERPRRAVYGQARPTALRTVKPQKGAARGMRKKSRTWEAAFASSFYQVLGRKPLFTVRPKGIAMCNRKAERPGGYWCWVQQRPPIDP